MFTGLVQSVGRIASALPHADGTRIAVEAGTLGVDDVKQGDSVAVAGCCLTVVAVDGETLRFDVSAETLRCTAPLETGARVNLEKALRWSDRLGGHLLSGHVDGVGVVARAEAVGAAGGSLLLEVDAPENLARFIAEKGSIAVDGVSLTVNRVAGRRFSTNLIAHTLSATTLGGLSRGSRVNLEVDLLARYIERLMSSER